MLKGPRWGVVSFADSLDCVGVLAGSVDTVKDVFGACSTFARLSRTYEPHTDVISVYDSRDPTAAPPELRQKASSIMEESCFPKTFSSAQPNTLDGLRIGIPQVTILHLVSRPLIPSYGVQMTGVLPPRARTWHYELLACHSQKP